VRIQAAMTLALKRDDRAAQSILTIIQGQEFSRRDSNERAAFFEALGRCGSDTLVPRLEAMLTKGGFFRSGGNEEERLHAALALAWLGTPSALGVLNREIGSKRDFVRKAVETALASVRSAGLGRAEGPREESVVDDRDEEESE
jgi:HEAT repeat protein